MCDDAVSGCYSFISLSVIRIKILYSSVQHGSVAQATSAIGKLPNLGNYLGAAAVRPPQIVSEQKLCVLVA